MWEREPKNTMVIKNVKINCGSSILTEYEYGELRKKETLERKIKERRVNKRKKGKTNKSVT
jgi:hypothetical protein